MKLFPYQDEGSRWLAGKQRALLADTMRLGKTPQAIVACDLIGAHSVLVVCPGIAREMWGRAWDQWSFMGRPVAVVLDKDDPIEPNGVTIVSMDGARSDALHRRVMDHCWDVLIVDETQFLKEPTSQRTKQVLSAKGFASKAGRIWFLTGSPMLNHPAELWVMLATIGATRMAHADFMNRYCNWFMGDYGPVVKGMKNVDELKALLAPHMLRRTYKAMFPDTPAPTWIDVELDPRHTHPEDYERMVRVEGHPRFGQRLKKWFGRIQAGEDIPLTDCIPKTCFAEIRHATSWAKIKPISFWLRHQLEEELIDKIVVFAHHGRVIEILQEDMREFGAKAVYGGTKEKHRQQRIDLFNTRHKRRVLIVQDNIARTAIDLTGANKLLFAELDAVPENNAQAAMRVQGPRQTKPVTIYCARLPNSTDDALTQILLRKSKMAVDLLG